MCILTWSIGKHGALDLKICSIMLSPQNAELKGNKMYLRIS